MGSGRVLLREMSELWLGSDSDRTGRHSGVYSFDHPARPRASDIFTMIGEADDDIDERARTDAGPTEQQRPREIPDRPHDGCRLSRYHVN